MALSDLISSPQGKIILSIIWGFGLAAVFRRACKGRSCIIMKGPKPSDMDKKVFSFDKKCYKYTAHNTSCKSKDNLNVIKS